jgi:hypothetical protein
MRDETRCDFHMKELLTHKVAISCKKVLRKLGLILTDAICDFCVKIASRLVSHLVLNPSSCLIRVNRPLVLLLCTARRVSMRVARREKLATLRAIIVNFPDNRCQ